MVAVHPDLPNLAKAPGTAIETRGPAKAASQSKTQVFNTFQGSLPKQGCCPRSCSGGMFRLLSGLQKLHGPRRKLAVATVGGSGGINR